MEKTARRYTQTDIDKAVAVERRRWMRLLANAIALSSGDIDIAEYRRRTRAAA